MDSVGNAVCASPDPTEAWEQIDWYKCLKQVRRLQARIVKATQAGRWGKVKALQHLLTHSFSAKALAVERVTENKGKKTSGVDKVLWSTKESRFEAIQTLKQRGYKPKPLKRIYIPKSGSKKMRPLSIPTMKDRAMETLYKFALEPIAESSGDPNSYGFRTARSTHDAISQCFKLLSRKSSPQWVLEGDSIGNRNWVFGVKDNPKSGNPEMQYTQLYTTASTKIQRHVKVKSGLNPFDANWWGYLEIRKKQNK